ncbi:LysR family transcriptional regulator [Allopusillimonas ginsengisoli]|uniref:LysR family transcriptional regulator n=1 Tax=Allopusillimonas ginsengisoli TaxID=453575 RepID=UPI0039C1FE09
MTFYSFGTLMHLDPTSLRLFLSVLEEGTIARAAEREFIAAAAVSKRISELEESLKTKLLTRTNKGVTPTTAGLALSSLARRALHGLEDVAIQMSEYSSGARGIVRVVANISVITQFLPDDIKRFHAKYPNVQIQLEEKVSTLIIKAVQENSADVGIFSNCYAGDNLQVLPYKKDRLTLIVPAGHPLLKKKKLKFEEALNYDFIGLHQGSNINHIVAHAADNIQRNMNIKIQVTGFDTLCFMVDAALGIGVLPVTIARMYSKIFDIRLIPIEEDWSTRSIDICMRSKESLPTAARLFVEHLTMEQ